MPSFVTLTGDQYRPVPSWALLQRRVLSVMSEAALYFAERYTHPDGSLVWARTEWKGMDGSDDAYESAYNLPLLYALGGDSRLLSLSHHLWDGITRQFTAYGQIHREFDGYYDWMHHGESSLFFYYLSLAGSYGELERERAVRFANLYTGDDPSALNYDPGLRLIRSPLNGSLGPRLATTAEDWCELRRIYSQYPAPFTDLPGMHGFIADWNDPVVFQEIVTRFNEHIARGDVPINLLATSLVSHAYMVTGDYRYRQWVLEYLAAWVERARQNDGIVPDNVGLSGAIGEHNEGKWWGGYYGWGWPHGGRTLLEAITVAGMNAVLLTGDYHHLRLYRSQLDWLWSQCREVNGRCCLPWWRDDHGWREYRHGDVRLPVAVWSMTQAEEDRTWVERLADRAGMDVVHETGWGDESNPLAWYRFVTGHLPEFPEGVLQSAYRHVVRRLQFIHNDPPDPRDWPPVTPFENDVHCWQNRNPVTCEGLVQTMWGAPMPIYHGGLLQAQLRYFDESQRRAGLPSDVAALVEQIDERGVSVRLVNLDVLNSKSIIVQGGSFGEHTLVRTMDYDTQQTVDVHMAYIRVVLQPAASWHARIEMSRHSILPHYSFPQFVDTVLSQ